MVPVEVVIMPVVVPSLFSFSIFFYFFVMSGLCSVHHLLLSVMVLDFILLLVVQLCYLVSQDRITEFRVEEQ